MNKCIKIFENYLNRLGKNIIFWRDEQFLSFLKIQDPYIFKKLSGKIMKSMNDNKEE